MNVIAVGAHPDDCEYFCGGTAVKLAAAGHRVKFVSVTNGDAGHHVLSGEELVATRKRETEEAGRRLGVAAYDVLGYHDGLLEPSLDARREIIREIREWKADVVMTHRPNDYHPDHRATSQLVQDSAYMVLVPNVCPETQVLRVNPVYLYLEDDFRKPAPFEPDVAVAVDDVWEAKLKGLDAHTSQMYEWLPWVDWGEEDLPDEAEARLGWLSGKAARTISAAARDRLVERYGEAGAGVVHAESFELCEYGRQVSRAELREMLPE